MIPKKIVNVDRAEELICTSRFGTFFGVPQSVFDQVWQAISTQQDNSVAYVSMEIGADPDLFHPVQDFLKEQLQKKSENPAPNFGNPKLSQKPFRSPSLNHIYS